MRRDWTTELDERGWVAVPRGRPAAAAPRLAEALRALGATRVAGRVAQAVTAGAARPNTLSSRFGLGEFPLHTDGANGDDPPRYVVLASTLPRAAATLVLDARGPGGPLAGGERALFRVHGQRSCHYSRFRERRACGSMVRYNPATHTAVNDAAAAIEAALAASAASADRIDWRSTRVAVIDNWACLHGRERVGDSDRGRMRRLHVWTRP